MEQARQLGHDHLGTEHLLLGLLGAGDGVAAQVLTALGADHARVRQQWAAGVDVQAVVAENQRVHRELDRMRGLLREHGIEPDDGTARSA